MAPMSKAGPATGVGLSMPTSAGGATATTASLPPGASLAGTLPVGSGLGRYHIIRLLGSGGMGHVYHAWDGELGEAVALKVIRGEFLSSEDAEARFKRELSVARQVTHKNVIRIFDLGQVEGIKYISMQFVDGSDLSSLLKAGPIPLDRCLDIVLQLCAGLGAAHQKGIVHRDLKPANIMVDKSNNVYLMDFGLARSVEATQYTSTGAMIGTFEYMSPEQAMGKNVDHRSDIFTLGIVLYELFTGERPYQGDTPMSRLSARLHEPAPNPRVKHPELPGYIAAIILRCLERDVDQRYQSCEAVAADLTAQRAAAMPWHVRIRSAKFKKHAAVAAVSIALLGGGYAVVNVARRSAPATTANQQPAGPTVSMAILPFKNASGDSGLDWLGRSMAQMLLNDVGNSSYLRTVSSDRLHQILDDLHLLSETNFDTNALKRIAEFANADSVIHGQYSKVGEQIRIDAIYEDFKKGQTLPLKVEALNENDLLKAVDQLAQSIQRGITSSPDTLKELQAKAFKPSSTSVQAIRYYNEGHQLVREGNNAEALKQFEESVKQDPNFALAYSGLAQAYAALGQDNEAEQASRRATEIAQNLPAQERYLISAVHAKILNDNAKAIESYENLVKAFPEDFDHHFALAGLYENAGSFDKARAEYNKVLSADPKHFEALFGLGRVEIQLNNPQGALDYLNNAQSVAIRLENDEAKGKILHAIGVAYMRMNKYDDALRYYQDALTTRTKVGQKGAIASTINQIAQVENRMGKADSALSHYNDALKLFREVGDKSDTAAVLLNLGSFHMERAKYDDALKFLKESLPIQQELGNAKNEALCLNNIGGAYLAKGQFQDALTYFQQSLTIREKLKSPTDIAQSYHNLAETTAKIGQYDQALGHYLRAIELKRNAGDKRGAALESYGMATIFDDQGRYGAALKSKEDALKTFRELDDRSRWMAEILSGYGVSLGEVGRWEDARKNLDEALKLAQDTKSDAVIVRTLNFQGDTLFYRGDLKGARSRYEEALPIASKINDQSQILLTKANLAKLDVKEGRSQSAIPRLRELSTAADTLGLRALSIACSVYSGEALLNTKDYARARTELEGALSKAEKLGLQTLQAQSRDLLGSVFLASGKRDDASRNYTAARQILDGMGKESGQTDLLKRSDLTTIVEHSARSSN
jgi:eukaryotic-like serine/threonine-protein kinase